MRKTQLALLLGSATIILTGCSAGRAISNPFNSTARAGAPSSTGYVESDGYHNEYDRDPPAGSNQVAIDPNPVPPARGISFTKQISLTTTTVGRRRHLNESQSCCNAPAPTCVAPQRCGAGPTCRNDRYESTGRGLFSWFCPNSKNYGPKYAPLPEQRCAQRPSSCIPEATCCVPQTACIPGQSCVQEYARPLASPCCPSAPGCQAPRSCGPHRRPQASCRPQTRVQPHAAHHSPERSGRGLFGRLFGGFGGPRHRQPGSHCPASRNEVACVVPGCGHEGCVNEGCSSRPTTILRGSGNGPYYRVTPGSDGADDNRANDYDRSPLADPMEDPFAEPADSDKDEDNKPSTPVPAAPKNVTPPVAQPLKSNGVPQAPEATPLKPMPPGNNQAWNEPRPWHRLTTPPQTSIVVQPRPQTAWSTGWSQQ